jgi:hypothetical protein
MFFADFLASAARNLPNYQKFTTTKNRAKLIFAAMHVVEHVLSVLERRV